MKKIAMLGVIAGLAAAAQADDGVAERARRNAVFATATSVQTVPALRYVVLKSGPETGGHPIRSSAVQVRYEGSLTDGTVFDSSEGRGNGTAIFPVRGVIPGFSAAVQMMRPGDEWLVYVPKELAYAGGGQLAGKDLIFRITLVDFAELPPPDAPLLTELPKH